VSRDTVIRAVFLDIDGTLVDSNEAHVSAWIGAFAAHSYPFNRMQVHPLIGRGSDQLIPALLPGLSQSERQEIAEAHDRIFREKYLAQVQGFHHAPQFVAALHDSGLKVVLASSAKRDEVDHHVSTLGIGRYLHAVTSADDVTHSKPAGDIFVSALAKVAPLVASEAMVVGDTPWDVLAANEAGIAAIGVLSGGFTARELKAAGAVRVYDHVDDLLTNLRDSPLATCERMS
jgi:HAD superfamily hydrolase (TIGR01509 family)